jgi:hypothetical protein
MQRLEGSGTPVLYIGFTVLKGYLRHICYTTRVKISVCRTQRERERERDWRFYLYFRLLG